MFDPTTLREKLATSRLEEDDFVINDIALKIPPQQISINKQSYINKWDGLRLAHPIKSKSGHGIASVSFSSVFVGNVAINETLRPIVAGLRATPFCVIHNKYLSQCFQEISGKQEERLYPYRKFQPVVLALTSMSFSTIPGKPDCINSRFDFIWFNYLPYTPIWAYKTGNTFDAPGPVWESELWKQFYLPYLSDMKKISWPHLDHRLEGRMIFRWRDYALRYTADSRIDQQTADLITSIQRSPDKALSSWKSVIQDTNTTTRDVYDRYWNKLVDEGVIDNTEAKAISNAGVGNFTAQSQAILKPLMKRLSPQFFHGLRSARSAVNENKTAIQNSLAELNRRITQTKQLAEENSDFDPSGWNLVDLYKMRVKFRDSTGNETDSGGFNIFTKIRSKVIGPSNTLGLGTGTSIEGMSITFTPSLSVIPMIGHSYPTCQFCGGYDIDFTLDINDTNPRINQIQQIYDSWNKVNLRFRMVPQGYRNIKIENDFTQLFGVQEWLPVSIEASTIPEQPGRTHAVMTFTHAGITSDTRFDDPEELTQEFVRGSDTIFKKIWKIFEQKLEGTPLFTESSVGLFRFKSSSKRDEAFVDLLNEAIDNYNEVIRTIVKKMFSGGSWKGSRFRGGITTDGSGIEYYSVFSRLTHSNKLRGFIPGLEMMKETVEKIKRMGKDSHRGPILRTQGSVSKAIQTREVQREYTTLPGDDPQKQKFERGNELQYHTTSLEQVKTDIDKRINELGIQEYQQKMNALFIKIDNNYKNLPEFQSIAEESKREGINKGKPAYPDFKRSLISIGSFLDASFNENKIIEYDPDHYLWYPAYNGSLSSGVLGSLIDPILLNQAKQHSIKVYQGAFEATSKYFKEKYMKNMEGSSNLAPFKALKEYSGGELAKELYKSTSFKNTTREDSEGEIKVSVVPDPGKTPSSFYVEKNPKIRSDHEIQHTTIFEDLWQGVQTDSGEQNRTGVKPQKAIQPEVGSVSSPPILGTNLGIENRSFEFSWPPKKSVQQPNENGLVCPIESYTRATEPVGARRADATAFSWESYRRKAVVLDWNRPPAREKLQQAGFSDPNLASKQLSLITGIAKPVEKWSFNDYIKWKNAGTGRKLGYVHKGVDLWADVGIDVYSIADGIIKYITKTPEQGAGLFVEIYHSGNRFVQLSRYLHLQAINPKLKKGVPVKAGDRIGVVGRSGYPKTTPHLHFETWRVKGDVNLFRKKGDLLNPIAADTGIPWKGGVASGRKKLTEKNQQRYSILANASLDKDAMSTPLSPIKQSINEFEMSLIKGQGQRLTRAYPTFKLYFIEDDSGQRKRLGFDDFFSYNCVQSIRVVKSRKIAADLCILELVNVSGTLSNRKFRNEAYSKEFGDQSGKPRDSKGRVIDENSAIDRPMLANTKNENPIASLLLQEGIDIHLKMGFSNDPEMLDPVFTGKIQAISFSETDDLITVLAQSHATELIQDIKGVNDPKVGSSFGLFGWEAFGFKGGATTGRIIEEMLAQPEVIHFGRWKRGDNTQNRELLTNKFRFVNNPSDDNVFAPPPKEDFELANGFIVKDLDFTIYRTTIWEILKEMELRHPNFIGSPVPYSDKYGERMTYFFGLPNQLYFARNPNPEEQMVQNKIKKMEEERQETVRKSLEKRNGLKTLFDKARSPKGKLAIVMGKNTPFVAPLAHLAGNMESAWKTLYKNVLGVRIIEDIHSVYRMKRLRIAREQGYITPFRKYHLYTSSSHIVSNNIKADARDTANTVIVNYKRKTSTASKIIAKAPIVGGFLGEARAEVDESFVLKLDNALPTEDMRTQISDCVNVGNSAMAKNYALSMLQQNIKDIYKGELIIIGDPSVKVFDQCFLLDEYTDMVGCVEVEQVTHVFTKDQGFLTEIKPDMVCAVSEWSTLSTSEALGIIMEGMVKKMFGVGQQSNQSPTSDASKSLSSWGQAIGSVSAFFGGFLARKIINFTQTGHPIITVPLLYHGRELSGGIPTRKLQYSIWETIFGEWKNKSEGDLSYGAWSEDLYDGIMKTIKKATGGYSTGNLNLFGQNTLDS